MKEEAEPIASAVSRKQATAITFLGKMDHSHLSPDSLSNQSLARVYLIGANSIKLPAVAIIVIDFTALSL